MRRLWAKAQQEMRPGSLLISHSFPVPDKHPSFVLKINDAQDALLFCYEIQQKLQCDESTQADTALGDHNHGLGSARHPEHLENCGKVDLYSPFGQTKKPGNLPV